MSERNKNFGRRRGQWLDQVHDDSAFRTLTKRGRP